MMGYPDIAALAAQAPAAMSALEFRNRVMQACLDNIDQ